MPSDSFLGGAGGDIYDFYSNTNVADDVNTSVRALPNNAVSNAYVWMEYHYHNNVGRWGPDGKPSWLVGQKAPAFAPSADTPSLRYPYSTDENGNTDYQPESGSGI